MADKARRDGARRGNAGPGKADEPWPGAARLGKAWQGMADKAGQGRARPGGAWPGVAWQTGPGTAWRTPKRRSDDGKRKGNLPMEVWGTGSGQR